MADATTLPTVSPKQLGKQLRAVRRRKGLSLSEVARGAGLSRRELVAYERGKVEIPESDLWVIAGSCGVDVAELVPPTDPKALPSGPESIEDSITQLRRSQTGDSLQRHLDTLYALRSLPPGSAVQLQEGERAAMADSLGGNPATIEHRLVERMRVSKDEAKRLRALILPDTPRYSPLALDAPAPAPVPYPEPTAAAPVYDAPAYDPAAVFAANGVAAPDLARVRDPDLAAAPVDVFEELAKLPEPVALPDQHAAGHDMFSPPPEPVTVPASAEAGASGPFAAWSSMRSALPEPSGPVVVEPAATAPGPGGSTFGAAHAPPIDVVGRIDAPTTPDGSWDPPHVNGNGGYAPPDARADLGGLSEFVDLVETDAPAHEDEPTRTNSGWEAWWTPRSTQDAVDAPDVFRPEPVVTPLMPEAVIPEAPSVQMIEFVDDFVADAPSAAWPAAEPFVGVPAATEPPAPEVPAPPTFDRFIPAAYEAPVDAPMTDAERYAAGVFEPAPTGADPADVPATDPEWTASPAVASWLPTGTEQEPVGFEPPETNGWSRNGLVPPDEQQAVPHDVGSETPWGHQPDADASRTGFYVDWGSEDATSGAVTDTADNRWVAAALDTQVGDTEAATLAPVFEEPQDFTPETAQLVFDDATTFDATKPDTAAFTTPFDEAPDLVPTDEESSGWVTPDEPAPISWRPLADTVLAAVAVELATRDADTVDAPTFEPEPVDELVTADEFVTAGEEWELGNALPLVEVRGQGGLVMRRADERWALADVHSATSFALEVDVDFRSGPGFGVLFRASTDEGGHMSGYSFDVDPIHEGGSYLVRQWQADRELWNPIAHVPAADPSDMHGRLTLRIVVLGDSVSTSVNGDVVLSVDSLERACAERNREPAAGDRVGIQAWSSSDLVIDTLRVAQR